MSERLSGALKAKDTKEVLKSLQAMFNIKLPYDVEENVMEFIGAMTILVGYEGWPDLAERVQLLGEAAEYIQKVIPGDKNPGNKLGSVLTAWPKGKKILDEAVLHWEKGKKTLMETEQFGVLCNDVTKNLEALAPGFGQVAGSVVASAVNSLNRCRDFVVDGFKDCLWDFIPTASTPKLAAITTAWIALLSKDVRALIGVLCTEKVDEAALKSWFDSSQAVRERLRLCIEATERCKNIMGVAPEGKLLLDAWSIVQALVTMRDFMESTSPPMEMCQNLQKWLATSFASGSDDVTQAMTGFMKSPIMASNSALRMKLQESLMAHCAAQLKDFKTFMCEFFKEGSNVVSLKTSTIEVVKEIAAKEFNENDFNAVVRWASGTGDHLMLSQVSLGINAPA